MILYPAIDLKDGNAVRLVHGDMGRETVFNENPAAQAMEFVKAGCEWLHLVDLNGAFAGEPLNAAPVEAILSQTNKTNSSTTTMKKTFLLVVVVFFLALATKVATGGCLIGNDTVGVVYPEGHSFFTIGWECHKDNKTYDGTEMVCQNNLMMLKWNANTD